MSFDKKLEKSVQRDSDILESELSEMLLRDRPIAMMRRPLSDTSLLIPKLRDCPERLLTLDSEHDKDKALLFRVVVAAYNFAFTSESAATSSKPLVSQTANHFVEWLNATNINSRYRALKEYEAYMFDKLNNHGGLSGLVKLKALIELAFRDIEFDSTLSSNERLYLLDLLKTKVSPNINKAQVSLASYFGALDWLRDENIGVGNELYNVFASPKLSISSLQCVASVVILEIYKAKLALRTLLKESGILPAGSNFDSFKKMDRHSRAKFIGKVVYQLLMTHKNKKNPSTYSELAVALVIQSNSPDQYLEENKLVLYSNDSLRQTFLTRQGDLSPYKLRQNFTPSGLGNLFSLDILYQLINSNDSLPVTELESMMFAWLMACLTVQPSDISKLSREDFRFVVVGGKVRSIECEYFKGRADAFYNTRSLSTKKLEGKALLTYIEQTEAQIIPSLEAQKLTNIALSKGNSSLTGELYNTLSQPMIDEELRHAHYISGEVPMLMPMALKALIKNGIHVQNVVRVPKNTPLPERKALVAESNAPCMPSMFGLQAIKNSAVHAYSDPYTLHYLINFNSHTNKTEKTSYLTPDNEEWINSSGRITRSVMIDLINNVFDLDFSGLSKESEEKEKASFNHEFASITDTISYKKEEILSRLRVVTNQEKGAINEVGVMSYSADENEAFAPIYVLDSPVTVCKMMNFIYEFEHNYKKILCRNPDYFYRSALPTVEWMEHVLSSLSKASISEGQELFKKMRNAGVYVSVFHSI